ncbi:MAG: hypothetical protein N4A62_03120 [Marinisporobacter sp.]|jgi:predicted ATPase|nr:hypothetical protein [Marinisporobacter sp.]
MIKINISEQKQYVPLRYQPIFKVAQVLQILKYSTGKGKSASLSYLHTIAWAIRSDANTKLLIEFKSGKRNSLVPWCFEPAIDKAIIIALVNGYCKRLLGGKIKIDKKGEKVLKILEDNHLLAQQMVRLKCFGNLTNKLTENQTWEVF